MLCGDRILVPDSFPFYQKYLEMRAFGDYSPNIGTAILYRLLELSLEKPNSSLVNNPVYEAINRIIGGGNESINYMLGAIKADQYVDQTEFVNYLKERGGALTQYWGINSINATHVEQLCIAGQFKLESTLFGCIGETKCKMEICIGHYKEKLFLLYKSFGPDSFVDLPCCSHFGVKYVFYRELAMQANGWAVSCADIGSNVLSCKKCSQDVTETIVRELFEDRDVDMKPGESERGKCERCRMRIGREDFTRFCSDHRVCKKCVEKNAMTANFRFSPCCFRLIQPMQLLEIVTNLENDIHLKTFTQKIAHFSAFKYYRTMLLNNSLMEFETRYANETGSCSHCCLQKVGAHSQCACINPLLREISLPVGKLRGREANPEKEKLSQLQLPAFLPVQPCQQTPNATEQKPGIGVNRKTTKTVIEVEKDQALMAAEKKNEAAANPYVMAAGFLEQNQGRKQVSLPSHSAASRPIVTLTPVLETKDVKKGEVVSMRVALPKEEAKKPEAKLPRKEEPGISPVDKRKPPLSNVSGSANPDLKHPLGSQPYSGRSIPQIQQVKHLTKDQTQPEEAKVYQKSEIKTEYDQSLDEASSDQDKPLVPSIAPTPYNQSGEIEQDEDMDEEIKQQIQIPVLAKEEVKAFDTGKYNAQKKVMKTCRTCNAKFEVGMLWKCKKSCECDMCAAQSAQLNSFFCSYCVDDFYAEGKSHFIKNFFLCKHCKISFQKSQMIMLDHCLRCVELNQKGGNFTVACTICKKNLKVSPEKVQILQERAAEKQTLACCDPGEELPQRNKFVCEHFVCARHCNMLKTCRICGTTKTP